MTETRELTMRNFFIFISLIILITGCQFQKPEYLKMISPAELHRAMQDSDIFLVDVHTPQQRHIKGTDLFIPYNEVENHLDKLPQDKNTAVYLYCEGGPMGNAAARKLSDLGYTNLINLEGGANAWKKAGYDFE
jgi:rhodanese-related sulfurtransferase